MNANNSFFKNRISLALAILLALLASTGALAADGILDSGFGTGGVVITDLGSTADAGSRAALSPDGGKIWGLGSTAGGAGRVPVIVRYNSDGSLDTGYDADGQFVIGVDNFFVCDFAIQSDGKVIVVGTTGHNITLLRYLADSGTLDTTFGTNGIAVRSFGIDFQTSCKDILLQPDQKILVTGSEVTGYSNHTDFFVARFNTDGSSDETFVGNGFNIIDWSDFPASQFNYGQALAVQPDGKIIVAGVMQDYEGDGQFSFARLNTDGRLDTSFGTNGKGTVTVAVPQVYLFRSFVALQSDGKILAASTTTNALDTNRNLVLTRLNSNGTADTAFGVVTTDFGNQEVAKGLALQKDGKIVVAGNSSTDTATHFMVVRYTTGGQLDSTFGASGKVVSDFGTGAESIEGAAMQPDGKLLAVGTSNNNDMALARYSLGTTGATPTVKTFASLASSDGWVLETGEITNVGGTRNASATTFNVGDNAKDRQYRGFLSFQTMSIPDNAFVTSVQVKIKRQGIVGVNPFTTHGNLLLEIRQGAFNNNAALEAADFSAPANSAILDSFAPLTSTWYALNLSGPNLAFVNKLGFTQFRLRFALDDNDDMNADYVKFFSGNSTVANWPQLIVTWYVP